MDLDEKIIELKRISTSINHYKKIKTIGYFLVVIIVGIPIVIFSRKRMKQLDEQRSDLIKKIEYDIETTFQEISKDCRNIIERNTYLIYQQKSRFIERCEIYLKNINYLNTENDLFSQKTPEFLKRFQDSILSYKDQINYITDKCRPI